MKTYYYFYYSRRIDHLWGDVDHALLAGGVEYLVCIVFILPGVWTVMDRSLAPGQGMYWSNSWASRVLE